jgi:tetratricopeptide (TPR) repeat protein
MGNSLAQQAQATNPVERRQSFSEVTRFSEFDRNVDVWLQEKEGSPKPPRAKGLRERYARCIARREKIRRAKRVAELKNKASAEIQLDYYGTAIATLTMAITLEPTNYILFTNRSLAYFLLQRHQRSYSDAVRSLQLNPQWVRGFIRKGCALLAMGVRISDFVHGREAFEDGLAVDPCNKECKQGVAKAKRMIQRWQVAHSRRHVSKSAERLVRSSPTHGVC